MLSQEEPSKQPSWLLSNYLGAFYFLLLLRVFCIYSSLCWGCERKEGYSLLPLIKAALSDKYCCMTFTGKYWGHE